LGFDFLFGGHAFFLKLKQSLQVIYGLLDGFVIVYPLVVDSDLPLNAFSAFGVVPEFRIEGLASEVFNFAKSVIDVKDTSLVQPACLSALLIVQQS
jgi:hypothetical protein